MSDIILHHYPFSPFAEKARLALGLKGMSYRSVIIPVQSPKPDLVALTGGYRRTPVLQHGADIYCDTLLILRVLEHLQPAPSLFPDGTLGVATAVGWWAEKFTYMPAVCLAFSLFGETFPEGLVEERSKFFDTDLSKAATMREQNLYLQRLHAHLRWLADMLADGRAFLLGEHAGAADLSAYHSIWFIRENGGAPAEAMLPLAPLLGWYDRVTALGHGSPTRNIGRAGARGGRNCQPCATAADRCRSAAVRLRAGRYSERCGR